ncbi:hypothetical protein BD770DRAFT_306804, partial [Pilaira anomala]
YLPYRLHQYAKVSNAKFILEKTEVFPLSDRHEDEWNTMLDDQLITKYHSNRSSTPFNYLRFYIV